MVRRYALGLVGDVLCFLFVKTARARGPPGDDLAGAVGQRFLVHYFEGDSVCFLLERIVCRSHIRSQLHAKITAVVILAQLLRESGLPAGIGRYAVQRCSIPGGGTFSRWPSRGLFLRGHDRACWASHGDRVRLRSPRSYLPRLGPSLLSHGHLTITPSSRVAQHLIRAPGTARHSAARKWKSTIRPRTGSHPGS